MPLIEVTQSQYVSATIRLESATASLVDQYAAFVHGTADDVVMPTESELNYGAAKEPKELVLVPGANHGDTIAPGEPSTDAQVREFFDRALRAKTVAA